MIKIDKNSRGFLFCFCLAGILGFSGCTAKPAAGNKESSVVPVKVKRVVLKDIAKVLEYVGNIKAQDEVLVYPKTGGKVVEKVKEEGSVVKKGDVLVYLDRDQVGLKFEKVPVESPLAGIVGRVFVDIGTQVFAQTALTTDTSQTPVALVVFMDQMKISLDIPEAFIPEVRLGQVARVTLGAYPGEEFFGTVAKVSPVLDLATRTAPIEIVLDNKNHRLKSGMFAKVNLILQEHKQAPVVYKEAVMGKDYSGSYVYVIKDGIAKLVNVVTGLRQGPDVEIVSGVQAGDAVVIMGQQKLFDGTSVRMEE